MSELKDVVVTKMESAWYSRVSWDGLMTNRRTYGLACALEGQVVYNLNGEKFSLDKSHALLFPRGATYTSQCICAGVFPLVNFSAPEDFVIDTFISFEISDLTVFTKPFEELLLALTMEPPARDLITVGKVYEIIGNLLQTQTPYRPPIVNKALSLVRSNLGERTFTVASLSNTLKVSEVYLRRLFYKSLNLSPHKYLVCARVNEAKQLLTHTLLSVGEIASKTGFADIYHFSKVFKGETGYTPTQYRHKYTVSFL